MPAVLTRRSAMLAAAGAALLGSAGGSQAAPSRAPADGGIVLGRAGAPVTVTEYASVTCGHCADWDAQVWPRFKARYLDTGKVRFELKEMLTPPTQLSAAGWMLARCAGPSKSLSVVEALYRSQGELARTTDVRGVLVRIGLGAGMTAPQVEQCLRDRAAFDALNSRVEAALQRGVDRTPTFFINGRKHEGGIDLEGLDAALAPLIARRR